MWEESKGARRIWPAVNARSGLPEPYRVRRSVLQSWALSTILHKGRKKGARRRKKSKYRKLWAPPSDCFKRPVHYASPWDM